jgi:hypothetical protein
MVGFDITLIGIKACLLASLYPVLLYLLKKRGRLAIILVTLIFMTLSLLLASRTFFFCILITLFFSYSESISRKFRCYIPYILVPVISAACLINWQSIMGRWFIMLNIVNNAGSVPFTGFGWRSFNLHYSQWQSAYFISHPAPNIYSMVADCPLFAFNEILHFYVEIGIVAPVVFLFFWIANLRLLLTKVPDKIRHYAIACLVILIFSLVSYPFHSIWIVLVFAILNLLIAGFLKRLPVLTFIIIIGVIISCTAFYYKRYLGTKSNWVEAQMIPFSEKTEKRTAYEALLPDLYSNPYFLKGYVDYLLDGGKIVDAQKILIGYEKYFIRYDYLMSLGQSFLMQNEMEKAGHYYSAAHYLIPNRFVPLAFLMRIAIQKKDNLKARDYANQIVTMHEKIPSGITGAIKAEARQLINLQ